MKKVLSQLKPEKAQYLKEIILTNYKHVLVDSGVPNLIKEIISKGTPVVDLTSTLIGNFNQGILSTNNKYSGT